MQLEIVIENKFASCTLRQYGSVVPHVYLLYEWYKSVTGGYGEANLPEFLVIDELGMATIFDFITEIV
ncbi:hypothetical protein D3C84_1227980 [compost metagenome]